MFREYVLFMLSGHILGDYYTQTASMAQKKSNRLIWVLIHSLMYFITFVIVSLPVLSLDTMKINVMVSLCHGMVDLLKFFYLRRQEKESPAIFLIDQCIHLMCIVVLAYIWTKNNIQLREIEWAKDFFETVNISEILICKWILGLLVIYKPANILIQNLIGGYKPNSNCAHGSRDNKAGRKIGVIERFIIFIMVYLNQYSAIGLVLTAKSIARYDQITKDEEFAEYYLLGTLMSVGITVACTVMLF